jgi:hypothetical protein
MVLGRLRPSAVRPEPQPLLLAELEEIDSASETNFAPRDSRPPLGSGVLFLPTTTKPIANNCSGFNENPRGGKS